MKDSDEDIGPDEHRASLDEALSWGKPTKSNSSQNGQNPIARRFPLCWRMAFYENFSVSGESESIIDSIDLALSPSPPSSDSMTASSAEHAPPLSTDKVARLRLIRSQEAKSVAGRRRHRNALLEALKDWNLRAAIESGQVRLRGRRAGESAGEPIEITRCDGVHFHPENTIELADGRMFYDVQVIYPDEPPIGAQLRKRSPTRRSDLPDLSDNELDKFATEYLLANPSPVLREFQEALIIRYPNHHVTRRRAAAKLPPRRRGAPQKAT